jgi:hypothetical protein
MDISWRTSPDTNLAMHQTNVVASFRSLGLKLLCICLLVECWKSEAKLSPIATPEAHTPPVSKEEEEYQISTTILVQLQAYWKLKEEIFIFWSDFLANLLKKLL